MGTEAETKRKLEMYFFPFLGGGHMIPMIDTARVFASHGVRSTILAVPSEADVISKTINRDQHTLGLDIHLHILTDSSKLPNFGDMTALPSTDTSILRHPFQQLLLSNRPDCIVLDTFHRWATDVVSELNVPYIIFNGSGCFPRCVNHSLDHHSPQDAVESDDQPFLVPGLPDKIELTKSKLPKFNKPKRPHNNSTQTKNLIGYVINSFKELESAYVEHYKNHIDPNIWLIGPVSLFNRNTDDKSSRGQSPAVESAAITEFLASKPHSSVLYISFGSSARLPPSQFAEIAHALDQSSDNFIWAIGKSTEESFDLPIGWFEKHMSESKKGLIIRGWAPQLLILENPSVGGFMTHCGWNSMMEGVCAGVPMVTWPLSAEQFCNEKLVTEVLGVGVRVGSVEWRSHDDGDRAVIGREMVKAAVERVMRGGEEAAEGRRRRVTELGQKATTAVVDGGSSFQDVERLIKELMSRRNE